MPQKILQVNFRFDMPRDQFEKTATELAASFAAVPGCRWKVWLMNEAEREAGGIYLFDDDASVDALLSSELIAGVAGHPALSDFKVKRFDVLTAPSLTTRAPLHPPADIVIYPPVGGGAHPDLRH